MAYIQFDTSTTTVTANDYVANVQIITDDVENITVSSTASWVNSGSYAVRGQQEYLDININQNTTNASRQATITVTGTLISDPTDTITDTFTLTQNNGYYIIKPLDVVCVNTGGDTSLDFDIETNCSEVTLTMSSGMNYWYSLSTDTAYNGDNIFGTTETTNNTGAHRTGFVTMSGNGVSTSFQVTQQYTPYMVASVATIPQAGGRIAFELHTPYDFGFSTSTGWVRNFRNSSQTIIYENTRTTKPVSEVTTIYIDFDANLTGNARTGSFYLDYWYDWATPSSGRVEIQLTQAGAKTLSVYPTDLVLDYYNNLTSTFEITTNCSTVNISNSNIGDFSVTPSTGQNGSTITVQNNTKNTSGQDKTATITVSDPNGEASSQTVSVTQWFVPTITQYGGSSTVSGSGGTLTYTVKSHYNLTFANVPAWVHIYNTSDPTITYDEGDIIQAPQETLYISMDIDPNTTTSQRTASGFQLDHYEFGIIQGDRAPITIVQQAGTNGTIALSPSTAQLTNTGGSSSFSVSYSNIDTSTVFASCATTGVTTSFNSDKSTLTVSVPSTTDPRTITVTVTGQDYLGGTATGSATINQLGVPYLTISPSPIQVAYNTNTTTATITAYEVSNLTTSYSGSFITGATISGNTLTINMTTNSTHSDLSGSVTVSGTSTNGTVSAVVNITKYAEPYADGSITISPTEMVQVPRTGGTVIYNLTYSNILMSSVTASMGTFNNDKSVLTVEIGANTNPMREDRSYIVEVTGDDLNGVERSVSVDILQWGRDATLYINPATQTIDATTTTATYSVSSYGLGAITVSFTGDSSIVTNYTLANDELVVTTANNTSNVQKTVHITLSGTATAGGATLTATADLVKRGASEGYIVISPTYAYAEKNGGTLTFNVTYSNITASSVTATSSVGSTSFNSDKSILTVTVGTNSSSSNRSITVTVSGTDTGGTSRSASATITQYGSNPYLSISPASQTVSYAPTEANYTFSSYRVTGLTASFSGNVEITGYYIMAGVLTVYTGTNYSGSTQSTTITLSGVSTTGTTVTATATIYKNPMSGAVNVHPIWDEVTLTSTADQFVEYHIGLGENTIYAGKAYKLPDAGSIKWSINDVASEYLGTGITFENGIQQIPDYIKEFVIGTNTGQAYNHIYYNSWAYKNTNYLLSDPIDFRVDPRQWLPISILTTVYNSATVGSSSYNNLAYNKGYTIMTDLSGLTIDCNTGINFVGADGTNWNYKIDCGDYVLYYANAYGGWDSLLLKGTAKKTDNIEHLNYRKKSTSSSDFSKVNYQNNITPTWTLNTGYYINGEKMYHLLESTKVYLHNLTTNEIIPVVITNSECQYLTYKNNGKKPYYYQITVEESNTKIRK